MYSYLTYGIGLRSFFPLPELVPSDVAANVQVILGSLKEIPSELFSSDETVYYYCWTKAEEGTYLYWKDVATFLVRGGREVIVDPVDGVEEKRLRLVLLGAVLSIVLQQRGYLIFHASALAIGGSAVIFVGNKGWGKSTMAAVLYGRGHDFLADDVVAIDDQIENRHNVIPAFPQIKLWSDAITSMGNDPSHFPKVSSLVDKHEHCFSDRFGDGPVPLKCIYVLGVSDKLEPQIQLLKPQDALIYLIGQTYNARWGKEMFAKDSATHFLRCNNIVRNVSVYRLTRPKSLDLLPQIAQMVEDHVIGTL